MLPNFLCIGAFRSGTTWLYRVLKTHPDLYVPEEKETMFFSRYYDRGIDWYQQFFEAGRNKKIRAEICPPYLSHPTAAKRISKHIPEAKLLACLRNPADQVYSQYKLGVIRGNYPTSFHSVIRNPSSGIIENVFYAKHISRYLRYFDKSQISILLYDDLISNPKAFLNEAYRFLDISEHYPPNMEERVNYSREPRFYWLDKVIARAGQVLRNRDLSRLKISLNKTRIADTLKRLNSRNVIIESMNREDREYLNRLCADDKERLEAFIERDLSIWQ